MGAEGRGWGQHSPSRARRGGDRRTGALSTARALNAIARNRLHLTCIVVNGGIHPFLKCVATLLRARLPIRSWANMSTACRLPRSAPSSFGCRPHYLAGRHRRNCAVSVEFCLLCFVLCECTTARTSAPSHTVARTTSLIVIWSRLQATLRQWRNRCTWFPCTSPPRLA